MPNSQQPPGALQVAIAAPLSTENAERLLRAEPRIRLRYEPDLLPPMRHPADFSGDPTFKRTPEQQARFDQLVTSAEALYGIPDVDPAALAQAVHHNPNLRWVHTMAAGGGAQVKQAGLTQDDLHRVTFTTSAGVHGDTLAEWAVFGILAGAKDLPKLLSQQRNHTWSGRWEMRQLSELTVLVLGLGGIGEQVASKLATLGAHVIGTSRHRSSRPGESAVDELIRPDQLVDTIRRVDAVVAALPGTTATEKMLGAEAIAAAKPGLIVVNIGRGTVIDEAALIDGLRDGHVAFAALDVFAIEPLLADSPLWNLPNVLVSPHTAGLNAQEDRRIVELFADNATRLLDGRPMRNVVDTNEFY